LLTVFISIFEMNVFLGIAEDFQKIDVPFKSVAEK
jgi:hypothetical protein